MDGLDERIESIFIAVTESTKVNICKQWGRGVEFKTFGEKGRKKYSAAQEGQM